MFTYAISFDTIYEKANPICCLEVILRKNSIFHEFHEIQSWSIGQTSGYVSIAIKQDFGSPIIDVRLWNALTSWSVDYFISLLIKSAKLLTIERSKQAVALAWYYK